MDLHLSDTEPSPEEVSAVNFVLGPIQPSSETARVSGGSRIERHRLLPVLHAIQSRLGWISPGALNYACRRLDIPPAEAFGVASFYALFSMKPRPLAVAHVCDDIACMLQGCSDLLDTLDKNTGQETGRTANSEFALLRSPCLGQCERGPAALIIRAGVDTQEVVMAPATVEQILGGMSESFREEELASALGRTPASVPQAGQDGLRLLKRVGVIDPLSLDDYRAHGGYEALRRAFELGPQGIIREIVDSGLSGRGGAAFPTGRKWQAVAASAAAQASYLVCNADESEPGTFKDRILMEADPFAVIESMTIAALATGCRQGYIYIRGEYPLATEALSRAVRSARSRGFLGENIMGRGLHFDIEIRRGGGAYICGEETALFNSIEGYRGEPRNKPPFPTESGLFGRPTLVNNVETLVNVPAILLEGGMAFAGAAEGRSTETRLFSVSGHAARPGLYEMPSGTRLKELILKAGGVKDGRSLQAVLLGGAAGTFLKPDELDIPLTLEATRAAGISLGSGVVMLFDESADLKQVLLRIAAFFRDESCGQCVPCRVGTVRQQESLQRLTKRSPLESVPVELELLKEVGQVMRDASICGLGHTASSAIESAVKRWNLFAEGDTI